MDLGFPRIKYKKDLTHYEWGLNHGKTFKEGIKELAEIRKNLMLARNPALEKRLDELADLQWQATVQYSFHLSEELRGIAEGSGLSQTDIVILNNYTDFRDIELPEEGCSTIALKNQKIVSGQTWDMHSSAKNYLCVLEIEGNDNSPPMTVLSLVGCSGLMGISNRGLFVGVNNINTLNAKAALIWPVFVRSLLESGDLTSLIHNLQTAPVTSGHNYLISDENHSYHYEVTPSQYQLVSKIEGEETYPIFHTNHCLHPEIIKEEDGKHQSSTTHVRFAFLTKAMEELKNKADLYSILTSHEGYPKSVCSHYQSGAQDPSSTCGGGIYDSNDGSIRFWRGCPTEDKNHVEHFYQLNEKGFEYGDEPN